MVSPTPPPMYQTSHTPDPHPSAESIDPIQVNSSFHSNRAVHFTLSSLFLITRVCSLVSPIKNSMSLSSEQLSPSASQTQVFQPVSKAPHSGGINVNAAPFQSMQTVRPL